jgi:hypothetical protein
MSGIAAVSARMETGRLKIVRCEGTGALIRELGLYHYDPERDSEEPIDEDNHSADSLRYLCVWHDRGNLARPLEDVDGDSGQDRNSAGSRRMTEEEKRIEAWEDVVTNEWWWEVG